MKTIINAAATILFFVIVGIVPAFAQSSKESSAQRNYHEKFFGELPLDIFIGKTDNEKQERINQLKQKKYLIVYYASPRCGFCSDITPRVANFYNKNYNKKESDCGILIVLPGDLDKNECADYLKQAELNCLAMQRPEQGKDKAVSWGHPVSEIGYGTPSLCLFDENDNLAANDMTAGGKGNIIKNYFEIIKNPEAGRQAVKRYKENRLIYNQASHNWDFELSELEKLPVKIGSANEQKVHTKGTVMPFSGFVSGKEGILVVRDATKLKSVLKENRKSSLKNARKIHNLQEDINKAPLNSDEQIKRMDKYREFLDKCNGDELNKLLKAFDELDVIGKIPFKNSELLPKGGGSGLKKYNEGPTAKFEADIPTSSYLIYYAHYHMWIEKAGKKQIDLRLGTIAAATVYGEETPKSAPAISFLRWDEIIEKADAKLRQKQAKQQ